MTPLPPSARPGASGEGPPEGEQATFTAAVAERVAAVRSRIDAVAAGRPVVIVAVTKGFGPGAVDAAASAGITAIGENYAHELIAKAGEGAGGERVRWHFIGAVQRNKVADLAPRIGLWQSVAREVEGARIARFRPGAAVLVQVDATGLPGRNGCPPSEVAGLVGRLRDDHRLEVRGLMTVAAPGREAADAAFETVARLADELGLEERSMGMSDDLDSAVAAGTTMVRLGRALFGDRPGAPGR